MKDQLLFTLRLVVMGWAVFAVGPAEAQVLNAPGPYYPTPSWDQKLACESTGCPRFIVLSNWGNQAVMDRETGLVWEQSPSTGTFTWLDAQKHCNQLSKGNRLGWRLPTLQELGSLADQPGSLWSGHFVFTALVSNHVWSATSFAGDTSRAWVVFWNFWPFGQVQDSAKSDALNAWCVHKTALIRNSVAKRPRFHVHFKPTYAGSRH